MLLRIVFFLGFIPAALTALPVFAYEVMVRADQTAAGSTHKLSDVAYSIKDDDCLIRWNAIQYKGDKKPVLKVHRDCDESFEEQADYHEDILARINQDIPITDFATLIWGRFSYAEDYSWVMPMALASERSGIYHDYRRNYPHAKVNSINQIFVAIANQVRPYAPLEKLFEEYDVSLTLQSVEKVFTSRADKLPFYEDMREQQGVGRHARVIYDVGVSHFQLMPELLMQTK